MADIVNDPVIDVVMAAIPPREKLRQEAILSVQQQTLKPRDIYVALDLQRQGAGEARNAALWEIVSSSKTSPDFVAFIDDDDLWYPNHLQVLHDLHLDTGADFLYSWFDGNEGLQLDPEFAKNRGKQLDPLNPHHTTMNVMVRGWIAEQIRFRTDHPEGWELPQEDWRFILDCIEAGAKFAGTGEATWFYRVHNNNTSGMGDRW